MAYDHDLAERIRDLLVAEPELSEKKMFGGLAFLLDGRMAVAVSGQESIMVRVERDQTQRLIATTKAEPMVMKERELQGWVLVAAQDVRTRRQLQRWVTRGVERARAEGAGNARR